MGTRREILKCMNSKNAHIQFTAEKPSDFENDDYNIPTLDFKIGINEECDKYILRFYEKPMASKYFTPADSAMAKQQRDQIVAKEKGQSMFLTEEEARSERDKKK